jgi:hypothetical protein
LELVRRIRSGSRTVLDLRSVRGSALGYRSVRGSALGYRSVRGSAKETRSRTVMDLGLTAAGTVGTLPVEDLADKALGKDRR